MLCGEIHWIGNQRKQVKLKLDIKNTERWTWSSKNQMSCNCYWAKILLPPFEITALQSFIYYTTSCLFIVLHVFSCWTVAVVAELQCWSLWAWWLIGIREWQSDISQLIQLHWPLTWWFKDETMERSMKRMLKLDTVQFNTHSEQAYESAWKMYSVKV